MWTSELPDMTNELSIQSMYSPTHQLLNQYNWRMTKAELFQQNQVYVFVIAINNASKVGINSLLLVST